MGWTHSWRRETELPQAAFGRAAEDCRTVLVKAGVKIAGIDGRGEPRFTQDAVAFNGPAPASCEAFEICQVEFDRRGRTFTSSSCKTEHLPYDLAVQLVLIVLKHHFGDRLSVFSDGQDPDWAAARLLCQSVLGYGDDFRLEE